VRGGKGKIETRRKAKGKGRKKREGLAAGGVCH